jgi:L-ascorbate metabolism protein UlaG (beta-lactamase superfamily)
MKITKFEQSGFIFETDNGFKLALDIGRMTPPEKLEKIEVDAMVCSHIHADHFDLEQIKRLNPKKLYLPQECIDEINEEVNFEIIRIGAGEKVNIEEITVECFAVDHGPNVQHPKENLGFLFEIEEQKIYFAGDMFYKSGIDVTNLEVDIALIPVGTFYTFGPQEALDFIKKFKGVKKVVPIHYFKTPETPDQFIKLAQSKFNVEKM